MFICHPKESEFRFNNRKQNLYKVWHSVGIFPVSTRVREAKDNSFLLRSSLVGSDP